MDEGLLSLKWNNHKITFFNLFQKLRLKDSCTDVTISCGQKFFNVHKLVLMACSDFFYELFEQSNAKFQNPVIVFKDIKSSELEALLDYMYIGEVEVQQKNLPDIIIAAESLRIKGLAIPDDNSLAKNKLKSPERFKRKRPYDNNSSEEDKTFDQCLHSSKSSKNNSELHFPQMKEIKAIDNSIEQSNSDNIDKCNANFLDNSEHSASLLNSSPVDFPNLDIKAENDSPLIDSTLIKTEEDPEIISTDYFPRNDDPSLTGDPSSSRISSDSQSYDLGEPEVCGNLPLNDFSDFSDPLTSPSTQSRNSLQSQQSNLPTFPHEDSSLASGSVPFCQYCNKTFTDRYKRDRHLPIHTGEKPFWCPVCPYRASRKDHVMRHFRFRHSATLNQMPSPSFF